MRFLPSLLSAFVVLTSGCAVQRPQQLREWYVQRVKPGPLVWGGAHPIPQTPTVQYGPILGIFKTGR